MGKSTRIICVEIGTAQVGQIKTRRQMNHQFSHEQKIAAVEALLVATLNTSQDFDVLPEFVAGCAKLHGMLSGKAETELKKRQAATAAAG